MDFMHYDLGNLQKGHFVEVTLQGNAANVRLLDDESYQSYKDGDSHYYIGGLVQMSPVYLKVPQAGRWHLAVDMQGLAGSTESSVRLLQNPPTAMQNLMTQVMYNNGKETTEIYHRTIPFKNRYEVFIAYVTEDKGDVARPLAHFLTKNGVQAGFEEFEIKDGSGPIESLDKGLSNCRYGIIILSKSMLLKRWKAYEWESLTAKVTSNKKPIFPIWHNVTEQDIAEFSKSLSKKPARLTGNTSIEGIAREIANIINPQ